MRTNNKGKLNTWTIILIVSLVIILIMSLISSAMEIGEKLGRVHISLEILFYVLIAIVVIGGIVYPIVGVFFAPIFSLENLHNADGTVRQKWCKRLVNNLLENVDLTPEEQEEVKGFLKLEDETDDKLIEFFTRKMTPALDREIYDTAKKIFIVTAVSQNSVYDMLGMASANFSLIKRITEICGFRPNNAQVFRLYIRVLSMTLVAGNLEEMNLEELIPMVTEGALGKALGIVAASATQGAVNALTTLRMASITKNYLLNADLSQTRKELRRKSYAEAFSILKNIMKQGMNEKVKTPVRNVFGRKKNSQDAAPEEAFEEIRNLDPETVRESLKDIPRDVIVKACMGTSPANAEWFVKTYPEIDFEREYETIGRIKTGDIGEAQTRIINALD